MEDLIVFGLAFLAYMLLACNVVAQAWQFRAGPAHAWRRLIRGLAIAVGLLAGAHVALVWGLRFGWSPAAAVEKGWAGFVIFHTALTVIVAAALCRAPWSGRLTLLAFPIVTSGAVGAAFKYDYVAVYRWPLVGVLGLTLVFGLWGLVGRVRNRSRRFLG